MNKEKEFLENLYHELIHACAKARHKAKYFKNKGTNEKQVLKEQGKVRILSGLIIRFEKELGYRIGKEKYIDTIKRNRE